MPAPEALEQELLEDDALEDDALEDDALEDDALEDDGTADPERVGYETPDRGYELDLDKHSPNDLDAAIQDAVEAIERAGQAGLEAPDAGADGEGGDGSAGGPLEIEAAQLQERLLRTLADFDNYRKRTDREKESLRRLGVIDVMRDALSISDNLARALESPGGIEDLKQGVRMILRQHEEFLRRHGVEKFESVGQRFDPTVHEAVATLTNPEVEEPTVSEELQKGYHFHDRLLRPALVYVAMPSPKKVEEVEEIAEAAGIAGAEGVEEGDGRVVD